MVYLSYIWIECLYLHRWKLIIGNNKKVEWKQPSLVVSVLSTLQFIMDNDFRSAAKYQDKHRKYLFLIKTNEFCVFFVSLTSFSFFNLMDHHSAVDCEL